MRGRFASWTSVDRMRYAFGDMPEAMPNPEAPKKVKKLQQWYPIRPRDPDKVRALMGQPKSMDDLAREKAEAKGVSLPQPDAMAPTEREPATIRSEKIPHTGPDVFPDSSRRSQEVKTVHLPDAYSMSVRGTTPVSGERTAPPFVESETIGLKKGEKAA